MPAAKIRHEKPARSARLRSRHLAQARLTSATPCASYWAPEVTGERIGECADPLTKGHNRSAFANWD